MKVLYITSEARPYAASGGLADVAASLPRALQQQGVDCRVVLPLYQSVPSHLREGLTFLTSFTVPVAWRQQYCGVFTGQVDGVTYYLLDNEYYFKREGLYGHYDDGERFAFFARAVLEMLWHIDFCPQILHANDWQAALVPVYYTLYYGGQPGYPDIRTVYTIHNIQYQGRYGLEILEDVFGISRSAASLVEADGCINLMKGGIETAHLVSTVSPTYAREILDPWYAHGMEGILQMRQWKLRGILNGLDTDHYNPATDPVIAKPYSAEDPSGKAENKRALQQMLGLPQRQEVPIIAMVTRLVPHKGLDLVKYVWHELMQADIQLIILGTGDQKYEQFFREAQQQYGGKFCFCEGFHPDMARRIYAGADIFLMPSQSEPCGLAQMVACRYGTLPVVRETGGLKDSITDCGDGAGNGFTFKTYNAHDMLHATWRAVGAFHNKDHWPILVRRAMNCDFGWGRSAGQYLQMYRELVPSQQQETSPQQADDHPAAEEIEKAKDSVNSPEPPQEQPDHPSKVLAAVLAEIDDFGNEVIPEVLYEQLQEEIDEKPETEKDEAEDPPFYQFETDPASQWEQRPKPL